MMYNLLLVDDHALFRSGLRMILSKEADLCICAEAANGIEAVEFLRQTNRPPVHLVIMDINMPEMDGIEAASVIRQLDDRVKILFLTMYGDEAFLKNAMALGANGYIVKKAVDLELLTAVRTVLSGEAYVYPTLMPLFYKKEAKSEAAEAGTEPLSQRETEVLQYIALGYTQREIGEKLYISLKTVDTYKTRIMNKLNIEKRSDLVRYALKHHIVE